MALAERVPGVSTLDLPAIFPAMLFLYYGILVNLLLLAFNVLERVLRALKKQRQLPGSSEQLGELMDMFQGDPSWLEWSVLRDGERRRHAIAHAGELFSGVECLADIAAVEEQLDAWGVLES